VALAKVKDDLSKYLRLAAAGEIVITRHGRPAGVIIGFESDDDWFDYRLEHDPVFLQRIAASRAALARGEGVAIEDVEAVGLTSKWSRRPSAGSRRPASARARRKS
jgi:prevent-host-death family protein